MVHKVALLVLFLALSVSAQSCKKFEGVDFSKTGIYERMKDVGYVPCSCQERCDSREVEIRSRNCTVFRDSCSRTSPLEPGICGDSCSRRNCTNSTDLVPVISTEEVCTTVNQGPCKCCIRTQDYYLGVCQDPNFNGTCGTVCELCGTICGFTWCQWLDPTFIPPPPITQIQHNWITQYILVVLADIKTGACIPEEIWQIIFEISELIFRQKCFLIDLTAAQSQLLSAFLAGNLGTPLCPTCTCESDRNYHPENPQLSPIYKSLTAAKH